MRILPAVLTFCAICPAAEAAENPWATMAKDDLQAIHDTIEANHPGPVDPENPQFRVWLDDGLKKSMARAKAARSFEDYQRVLSFYAKGFEDGHVGIWTAFHPDMVGWTGFLAQGTDADNIAVVYAEPDAGVAKGAVLKSCDGKSVDRLMAERVDPYAWNRAIPQDRFRHAGALFRQNADDPRSKLTTCVFSTGEIALKWRDADYESVSKIIDKASASVNKPDLRKIDGVWMLSLPSFDYRSEAEMKEIEGVIAQVKARAVDLRKGPLVIDVRGNTGGSDHWGSEIAAALWGDAWVRRVEDAEDNTLDWRASPANLKQIDWIITYLHHLGGNNQDVIRKLEATRAGVATTLKNGQDLAHIADPPKVPKAPPPPDLMQSTVWFLTDTSCGSACLDFADLLLRLPHVVQVGLPTYADSMYLEGNSAQLPSRIAQLAYPMKVYRHRVRGNNEWYTPRYRWPGGPMNDDRAIVRWIKSLH